MLLRAFASIWDWINSILGTSIYSMPPQTYGTFLILAFLFAAFFFRLELKRKANLGYFEPTIKLVTPEIQWLDIILFSILSYFIGLKLFGYLSNPEILIRDPRAYFTNLQGNKFMGLVFMGLAFGWSYFSNAKKIKDKKPQEVSIQVYDRVMDYFMLAMVGGILGSNILDSIENPNALQDFIQDPIGSLTSGLSILGGLWLACILIVWYSRRNKIDVGYLLDSLAPGYILGYGIGRLGCHFSGDGCWGTQCNMINKPSWIPNWLYGDTYAHNVIQEGIPLPNCLEYYCNELPIAVFPTAIYEFLMSIAIFGVLWFFRKKWTPYKWLTMNVFLILNGLERFSIEFIRVNQKYTYLGFNLSQAQWISLLMILSGLIGVCYKIYQSKK